MIIKIIKTIERKKKYIRNFKVKIERNILTFKSLLCHVTTIPKTLIPHFEIQSEGNRATNSLFFSNYFIYLKIHLKKHLYNLYNKEVFRTTSTSQS